MSIYSTKEPCPKCLQNGKTSRLVSVNYRKEEAFYTCENKKCIYFITDSRGNPIKYRFHQQAKRLVPMVPINDFESSPFTHDAIIQSLQSNYNEQNAAWDEVLSSLDDIDIMNNSGLQDSRLRTTISSDPLSKNNFSANDTFSVQSNQQDYIDVFSLFDENLKDSLKIT